MATSRITSTSRVATQRDIDESQELQDRGIKKEFQAMRTYMDGRFEEQRSYTDDRFQQVDDRFQQVDDRFQQVEALMMNSRAASSWHDIVPIRVLNPLSEKEPPNFPDKVVKFWRLQRPRNQHQLVDLLHFYGIRASDLTTPISDDEEEEESDSLSESQSTLEEAVRANPTFALARLAARLGLDYGSISHNMGLYEQIQQARAEQIAQRAKREQPSEEDKRPTKKVATSPDSLPHRSKLSSPTKIPIELLVAYPEEFPYKSPTVQSYVGWALGPRTVPDSPTSRVSGSSSEKKVTTPSEPSGGSTIPFTPTPSVVKGARTTSAHTSTHTSSKQSQTSEKTSF